MTRKLLAGPGWVKDTALHVAFLSVFGVFSGCGAAPPPARPLDPYGERIGNCIVTPRGISESLQARMVPIEGGAAVLGSTEAERAQARRDYGPGGDALFRGEAKVRRASVAPFRIDRTPVTNEAYRELVESCGTPAPSHELLDEGTWEALRKRFGIPFSYAQIQGFLWDDGVPPRARNRHPVVLVTHDQAGLYCAWRGARLPSGLEWERAARGRQGRIYPWGDAYDPFRVNTAQRNEGDTVPVGTLTQGASAEGVLDLGGNVYEWTSTPWPGSNDKMVVKGNAWTGRGGYGRGAARLAFARDLRNVTLGFRCVADPI